MPTDFLRGLALGAVLVAVPGVLWMWTVQATGTAPVMMGDQAEQWTAAGLRKLQSLGWRLVNHFALDGEDMDHVLIGPGGAYVVETKWSASPWRSDFGLERQRLAVVQAGGNARRLRLWYPFKSRQIPVSPVVVLWGSDVRDWTQEELVRVVDGVPVIAGHALSAWTSRLGSNALEEARVLDAWAAIDARVARRDPYDQLTHPVPTSIFDLVGHVLLTGLGVLLGFVAVGELLRWTDSKGWMMAMAMASIGVAACFIKVGIGRALAWGWTAGVGIPTIAIGVAAALQQFT